MRLAAARGALQTPMGLEPLPIGSRLETATGTFTWNPGVAFVGAYDLVFDGPAGRQDVRIVLHPKESGLAGALVIVDIADGGLIAGWAIDTDAGSGTGIETLHVWAYPTAGGPPIWIGAAAYGGERPDVAAIYGDRFLKSGYGLDVSGLAAGEYDLAVFGWSTTRGAFLPAAARRVNVE